MASIPLRVARLPIVAAMLLLASCVHTPRAEPDSLRVFGMLQTIEIAPVHYTLDRIYPGGTKVLNGGIPNLFATGDARADIATHAETQALRNSLEHPDLRIIMTVTRGHYRIVARRSAGIRTLADLRGKTIATMLDTSSGFHLHNVLKTVGLSLADVTIISAPTPRNISKHIVDRSADVLAIWEPEAELAVRALGDDAIIFQPDVAYDELYNVNTTAAALADPKRRARIVRFVAGLIQASELMKTSPDEAMAMVNAANGYPVELIRASWPHHSFPGAVASDLLDVLVREEAWLAERAGRPARDRETLAKLIDTSIVDDARALIAKNKK